MVATKKVKGSARKSGLRQIHKEFLPALEAAKPGKYMLIPRQKLKVDQSYQRTDLVHHRIVDIAKHWNWIAFHALLVVLRKGVYYVVDGQHRKLAADEAKITEPLPCIVHEFSGEVTLEAVAFLVANSERTSVTSVARYRVALRLGEPISKQIEKMISESGYRAAKGGRGAVSCIDKLHSGMTKWADATRLAWGICVDISDGEFIGGDLFGSLKTLEILYRKDGKTLDVERTRLILRERGHKFIVREIGLAKRAGKTSDQTGAQAIDQILAEAPKRARK